MAGAQKNQDDIYIVERIRQSELFPGVFYGSLVN